MAVGARVYLRRDFRADRSLGVPLIYAPLAAALRLGGGDPTAVFIAPAIAFFFLPA